MHWHHRARPEAPMHMSIVRRILLAVWQLFARFLSTLPKLSVFRNLCAFSTVFISFLFLFFVISFENVRLVIQQIPSPSFSLPAAPHRHLHTRIPFVVFHVIPLAIRHFSSAPAPCLIICFLFSQCHFLCCTF